MNGFEAYQTYLAVTNHFRQKSYDYFRYNGKMKVSESSYMSRKDRWTFEKVAKRFDRDDFVKYLISNIILHPDDMWIGNMMNGKGEITYKKYVKNIESLTYTYKEDLETLYDFESNFNNIFTSEKGHPLLYRFYLRSKVHINTCVILNDLVGYAKLWRKQDDMMLNEFLDLLDKYSKFLYSYTNIDKAKYKNLTLEVFNES